MATEHSVPRTHYEFAVASWYDKTPQRAETFGFLSNFTTSAPFSRYNEHSWGESYGWPDFCADLSAEGWRIVYVEHREPLADNMPHIELWLQREVVDGAS